MKKGIQRNTQEKRTRGGMAVCNEKIGRRQRRWRNERKNRKEKNVQGRKMMIKKCRNRSRGSRRISQMNGNDKEETVKTKRRE